MREMRPCCAVKWYVETMALPKGVNVTVDIDEVALGMDGKKETKELNRVAFHIIRESLKNSMKYSSAFKIDIKCAKAGDILILEVRDNGIGFDYGELKKNAGRGAWSDADARMCHDGKLQALDKIRAGQRNGNQGRVPCRKDGKMTIALARRKPTKNEEGI